MATRRESRFRLVAMTSITTTIGVIMALFWQDAMRTFFDEVLTPLYPGQVFIYKIITATIITIAGTAIVIYMSTLKK